MFFFFAKKRAHLAILALFKCINTSVFFVAPHTHTVIKSFLIHSIFRLMCRKNTNELTSEYDKKKIKCTHTQQKKETNHCENKNKLHGKRIGSADPSQQLN